MIVSSQTLELLKTALAGRYEIEREIGAGGMATVYLARDVKHERLVALKVLRPELAATLGADRFLNEIRIAANLTHPHILPLHDSGEANGFLFYVMPYIEGESLRARLARQGELPVPETAKILRDVVDALAYAHQHGVVHRDVKPDNVLLSGRHALVTDFGVAKAVSEATGRQQLTTAGVALGTPAYMAPEQAVADPHVDYRADLYAVGVMAYEMLTGHPPFVGNTAQAVLAAHVTEPAKPITTIRQAVPAVLAQIVMQCLEKRPADRPTGADVLLPHFEALGTPSGGITPTATAPVAAISAKRGIPKWAMPAAGALLVAGLGFLGLRLIKGSGGSAQSIAVLPFESQDSSQAFADGIHDEILTDLTGIAALQVTSRSSVREYRNTNKNVRQIGTELGVRSLLQGQVQRAGPRIHVNVQLVDAPHDRQIWASSYERELTAENVFGIQGDIARNVAQALETQLTPAQAASLGKAPTTNLEALEWYHRGRALWDVRSGTYTDTATVGAFGRAVLLDSGFAEAWAGLAAARSWQVRNGTTSDTTPARHALDRAIALQPASADTRLAQGYYDYYARGDFDAALADFRAVGGLRPGDVDAIAGVGFIARRQGRWDEALAAEERVMALDPRSPGRVTDYGGSLDMLRRYDEAATQYRRGLILDPNNESLQVFALWGLIYGLGDTAGARVRGASAEPTGRAAASVILGRLARHYDQSNAAVATLPLPPARGRFVRYGWYLLNAAAAGGGRRTAAAPMADSARRDAEQAIRDWSGRDVFGNLADLYTVLGIADAVLGRDREAVQAGERAVELNPPQHDVVDGPRSVDGLIAIHIILGHKDEAIRLLREQAPRPAQSLSFVPTTRVALRLDPLFDSLRDDPRFRALLDDDAAWVVKH